MKKLFLTSVFKNVAHELPKLLPADPKDLRVAFVATAADMYDNKWFVEADRNALLEMGFKVTEMPLKDQPKEAVNLFLTQTDIVFVAGGNTFYLLQHARQSGFMELMPQFVAQGTVYIGSSAGSYLACPTIEVAGWKNQDRNDVGLTDLTGLNLVPFLLSVHYTPEHAEILKAEIAQAKYPVEILTDDQAFLVEDGKSTLVGYGDEIRLA